MSTLWDRVLADKKLRARLDNTMKTDLDNVVVLDGGNVSDWFYAGTDQEFFYYDQHYPNVAPPWSAFFVEARRPPAITTTHPDAELITRSAYPYAWGMLVTSEPLADDSGWLCVTELYVQLERHSPVDGTIAMQIAHIEPDGLFAIPDQKLVRLATAVARFNGIDTEVQLAPEQDRRRGPIAITPLPLGLPLEYAEAMMRAVQALHLPLWMAVCFTHFRNVPVRRETPPAAVSKKWTKRHGRPLNSYRVCDIRPAAAIIDATAATHEGGRGAALHIVRGHFKHYGDDTPLFGKHTGTWWWADRLAGQAQPGRTIRKDYRNK